MSGSGVGRASLSQLYKEKVTELIRLSNDGLSRLSPDAAHDLRVTTRRLQAMSKLAPDTGRTPKSLKFDAALSKLLKATSPVRDADTLIRNLQPFKAHLPEQLSALLQTEREKAAAGARASIGALAYSDPPSSLFHARKGPQKRYKRRVSKRGRSVGRLLGVVLNDESKVTELHALRKEVRKLRYLLELTDEGSAELSTLTEWQDALGKVHDMDVTVAFTTDNLARFKGGEGVLEALKRKRHQAYLGFRRGCRKLDSESLSEILN